MTEPRGSCSIPVPLLSRRESSSLEQPLIDDDDDRGEAAAAAEPSGSLLLSDTFREVQRYLLPVRAPSRCPRHHRTITKNEESSPPLHHHHIHPALEYEIVASASSSPNIDLLDAPSVSIAQKDEEERIRRLQILAANTKEQRQQNQEDDRSIQRRRGIQLLLSFVCLILFGSANSVALKLQAIPMYNYPIFLILFVNFMYIPICFAYIIPVARFGWFHDAIPAEHWRMDKRPFMIMGFLDGLATSMQIFSAVYLPGPLVVLLPQAAIPMSMLFSKFILHERFNRRQYVGAIVVLLGILLVLEPVVTQRLAPDYYCQALNIDNDCSVCQVEDTQDMCLSHVLEEREDMALAVLQQRSLTTKTNGTDRGDSNSTDYNLLCDWVPFKDATREDEFLVFVWSLVLIASCLPLTLSTVYKQKALGNNNNNNDNNNSSGPEASDHQSRPLDPIFLNGWISVYQFLFSVPLAIPAGLVSSPTVPPSELLTNLWNGLGCYAAGMSFVDSGCHPDDLCTFHHGSTFYVNLSLVMNVGYTISSILVVKYGSTALLFLALTVMVPISHLTFSMPFLPLATTTLHASDIVGLIVIMAGIILYRFSDGLAVCTLNVEDDISVQQDDDFAAVAVDSAAPINTTTSTASTNVDGNLPEEANPATGVEEEDPLLLRRTGDV